MLNLHVLIVGADFFLPAIVGGDGSA